MRINFLKVFLVSLTFASSIVSSHAQDASAKKDDKHTSAEKDYIIASAKGISIKKSDVSNMIKQMFASRGGEAAFAEYEKMPEVKKKVMNINLAKKMLQEKLIAVKAKKEGIEQDKEFKKALLETKNRLMVQFYLQKLIMAKFKENAAVSKKIEQIKEMVDKKFEHKIGFIVVKDETAAEAVIKSLDEGKDFIELAKTDSTLPENARAKMAEGDYTVLEGNPMFIGEVATEISKLKAGEYTKKAIKAGEFYLIAKVYDIRKMQISDDQAANYAAEQIKMEVVQSVADEVMKKNDVKFFAEDGTEVTEEDMKKLLAPTENEDVKDEPKKENIEIDVPEADKSKTAVPAA